ncbi:hypothetical protein MPLSOD_40624 [Mesorhizobium sp. SOD10]|nr:hypothetical protein MPLSOD_40624 [Mesorhizobium sp. SOD10]
MLTVLAIAFGPHALSRSTSCRWSSSAGPVGGGASASSRRSASMISSKETGRSAPGGWRSAGIDSTAQASDAQDERIARFSQMSSELSSSTSRGCWKWLAGDSSRSSERSDISGAREGMIGESVCRSISVLRLQKLLAVSAFNFSADLALPGADNFVQLNREFKPLLYRHDRIYRMFSAR